MGNIPESQTEPPLVVGDIGIQRTLRNFVAQIKNSKKYLKVLPRDEGHSSHPLSSTNFTTVVAHRHLAEYPAPPSADSTIEIEGTHRVRTHAVLLLSVKCALTQASKMHLLTL